MSLNNSYPLLRKSTVWLSILLFFIASCQTKKSIESLFDITINKNSAASKTTSSFNCSVYQTEQNVTSHSQKTDGKILENKIKSSIPYTPFPLAVFKVSESFHPLKIPLYLLFKNIKIAYIAC